MRVYSEMFPKDAPFGVLHTLSRIFPTCSDLAVIPNFIAKLASGISDDLASCVCLATRAPILIVPAMNDNMFTHPVTQRNIAQLKAIGYRFVDPVEEILLADGWVSGISLRRKRSAAVTDILSGRAGAGSVLLAMKRSRGS